MILRDEAVRTVFGGSGSAGYRTLDGLLNWLDDNADLVAEAVDAHRGVRRGWFTPYHAKALASILRNEAS